MKKAPRSESNPARILILDDEHDERCLLSGLTTYLTRSGYIVVECRSTESAVEQLQQDNDAIELLISDVTFAESSGVEVCLGLKASAPALKILFTAGGPSTEWSVRDAALFCELPSTRYESFKSPFRR